MHEFRKTTAASPKLRPHYVKILAFVYRNRFAIADQIQRRFSEYLKSDRTARRHLAEIEALGLLGAQPVNGVSPLMPKVYSVTAAGLRRLRKTYAQQGKMWTPYLCDRRWREGQSFPHIFHELAVTEFLVAVWQSIQDRADLELPLLERRSLVKHRALLVTLSVKPTIRSDNGSGYIAKEFHGLLEHHDLTHHRITPHCPEENGVMERANRTFREALEEVELTSRIEAEDALQRIIAHYNTVRLHSSLGYLRPVDYDRGDPCGLHAHRRRKLWQARHRRKQINLGLRQRTLPFENPETVSSH